MNAQLKERSPHAPDEDRMTVDEAIASLTDHARLLLEQQFIAERGYEAERDAWLRDYMAETV